MTRPPRFLIVLVGLSLCAPVALGAEQKAGNRTIREDELLKKLATITGEQGNNLITILGGMHKEIETLPNGDEHTAALKLVLALEVADTALQIVLAAGNVNRECACRSASTRKQMLLSLQAADGYIRGALANAYDLLPRIKNKAVLDAAAQAQVAFDTVTEAISSIPGARYQ